MDLGVDVTVEVDEFVVFCVALSVVVAKEASLTHTLSCQLVWSNFVGCGVRWSSSAMPRYFESEVHHVATIGSTGKRQDCS